MKKNNTRDQKNLKGVQLLGQKETKYPQAYTPNLLEKFKNLNQDQDAWTSLICTEFTSLCPKTSQPDFAKIFINYIAGDWMVESKSLKLYLFSFRNHGDFHEDCIQKIAKDLFKLMKPKYLEVMGDFTPRGGISIFPYVSMSNGEAAYEAIKFNRLSHYSPGKYGMDLSKLY